MILPAQVQTILAALTCQGYEAFVVGGCVRDALMGMKPKDFDITTDATPEEVKQVFPGIPVIETGIQHGTVTLLVDSRPFEVTTYRIDGAYLDRRRPVNVKFTDSLICDLSRRDFTINAMAYSPEKGLIDPFEGEKDIREKTIRCVGDPAHRFDEDALRILRAVRFASVLGFDIDPNTAEAMMQARITIMDVAVERITAEFSKLICGDGAEQVLLAYWPVLAVFLPEILPSIRFEQKNLYHIYDVFTHTAKVVSKVPPTLPLRIAAFFHDIGKPSSYTLDDKGIGHFYGHQRRSAEMAKGILNRMKYDNETKKRVYDLVYYHDIQIRSDTKAVKRILNRFDESFFLDLIELKKADVLAQNPTVWNRIDFLDRLVGLYQDILRDKECFSLKELAISGDDLLALGLKRGRLIGRVLKDCLDQVIGEKVQNTKKSLFEYVLGKYADCGGGKK